MRKRDELTDPNSCLNKARPDERLFVILERDAAAPATIRKWIVERIALGLNKPGDAKLAEAEQCARAMEAERSAPAAPSYTPQKWAVLVAMPGDPGEPVDTGDRVTARTEGEALAKAGTLCSTGRVAVRPASALEDWRMNRPARVGVVTDFKPEEHSPP